ncbi:MAG: GDP-mannose 4,6-dehydratase [Alphaproteobacteria bacterium]|nr:GDP-mannose 4,6-dehydratase [Alphaproteobacteria bacterium]
MTAQKTAFITGITGQDGALLAAFLLEKGYVVHGLRLYSATDDAQRLSALLPNPSFRLHTGDMTDGGSLRHLITAINPDEIYNLAAQSHVQASFAVPEATANINALGTVRLLDILRDRERPARFYQASSSEMFGNAPAPQNEQTPMHPCNPYGAAKLYAYHMVRIYREAYGLFACNGILFNHESPVRGEEFVTRKITRAVAAVHAGRQDVLTLGNLDARRDWGDARDYVAGMWIMLRHPTPGDYVLATGETHSVRDFVTAAFACTGIMLDWTGSGLEECGIDRATGTPLVRIDPALFRPQELHTLCGDAALARRTFGWTPKTGFEGLVRTMVEADIAQLAG